MKKITLFLLVLLCCCGLTYSTGCTPDEDTIRIGTMANPGEPILKHIKTAYEERGYKLEIVLFTDFAPINAALEEGSIDANLFQHEAYLNQYNKSNGTDLKVARKLYTCNYNVYSKKVTSLDQIPDGAKVAIADDASNQSRCLAILESCGLITLKATSNPYTINDVESNPKNLQIVAMSTSLIASTLDDTDCYLGIVNATFALNAKLNETAHVVASENIVDMDANANLLAVRADDLDAIWLQDLLEVLTSADTKSFIETTFPGIIHPYF